MSVAVPDGQRADHGLARLDPEGEPLGEFAVGVGHEQRGGEPAEHVLGAVPEEVLRGEGPLDDVPLGVLPPQGDRQQLAEHARVPDGRTGRLRNPARRLVSLQRIDLRIGPAPGGAFPVESP